MDLVPTTIHPPATRPVTVVDAAPGPVITHPARRAGWLRRALTPEPITQYLAPDELHVLTARRHWLVPARVVAHTMLIMSLTGTVATLLLLLAPGARTLHAVAAVVILAHHARMAWRLLAWRFERIVLTDRRLLRISGILTTTAETVHLHLVTDVVYYQSLAGRIFNYGALRVESAGTQSLALDFLPSPHRLYRAVVPR